MRRKHRNKQIEQLFAVQGRIFNKRNAQKSTNDPTSCTRLSQPKILLNRADAQRVLQRFYRISHGNKFVSYVSIVAGIPDCGDDCRVVDFLSFVKIISTGIARRVIVGKVFMVVLDGADQIAFHDLHVIDIVKQPYPR